jgi:hypothetical protein
LPGIKGPVLGEIDYTGIFHSLLQNIKARKQFNWAARPWGEDELCVITGAINSRLIGELSMHAIKLKMTLILTLAVFAPHALATIVPISDEVVEAALKSEGGSLYVDGYVQLNKNAKTISLVLQPAMPPCSVNEICTEVMPAPVEYFLEDTKVLTDECGAVVYQAEQSQDHGLKVTVVDNTQYNYELCPTFLPLHETVVQVEQTFVGPSSTEYKDTDLAGSPLSHIRY